MHKIISRYRSLLDNPSVPGFVRRRIEKVGNKFFRSAFELRHTRLYKYRVRVSDKISLTLWLDWMDYTDAGYLFKKTWETPTVNLLHKELKADDTFVDLGANVGYFSLIAAKLCPQGKVLAIEPLPRNIDIIRKNIASNQLTNLTLAPLAVSKEAGALNLRYRYLNSGSPSIHGFFGAKDAVVEHYMIEHKVETAPLLAILEQNGIESCKLIKMDAQGAEWDAVVSLAPLLAAKRIGGIVLEYNDSSYGEHNLATYLGQHGYRPHFILEDGSTKLADASELKEKGDYLFKCLEA